MFHFESTMEVGKAMPDFSEDAIKNEPMLFSCSPKSARELGGPITVAFLDALGLWGEDGGKRFDSAIRRREGGERTQ